MANRVRQANHPAAWSRSRSETSRRLRLAPSPARTRIGVGGFQMTKLGLAVTAAAAALTAAATPALAADRTYTVSGTYDDTGTLSGSFTYDAARNTYSSVSITTTSGSSRAGASFSVVVPALSNSTRLILQSNIGSATGGPGLYLRMSPGLTESTTTTSVTPLTVEGGCATPDCSALVQPYRAVTVGTVAYKMPAAIPTMSEWAMILMGTMLAGGAALYIQRRQRAI